jgi:hypothetical protein
MAINDGRGGFMNPLRGFVIVAVLATAVPTVGVLAGHAQQKKDQKSAPGVAGQWTLNVKSPHGEVAMGLDLAQDGKKVTGTLATPHGDLTLEGEFAANTLTLATPAAGGERITMTAKLTENGTLAGYLSGQMGDMTWTAKRAAAK